MSSEYTAILVYNNPTLMQRIENSGPKYDFLWVVPRGEMRPFSYKKEKVIARIDFTDSRSIEDILKDAARNCRGNVTRVPLPPNGIDPAMECIGIPRAQRRSAKRLVEEYFNRT